MTQTQQVEVSTEELASAIAEGVHTGLRKGTDAEDSVDLWQAIRNSRSEAWGEAAAFCAAGLKMMGYTITKDAE